jgi:D-alanine-D-alanine ligase
MESSVRPAAARRVYVIYNCDYDEELVREGGLDGADESAVRKSALEIVAAVREYGLDAELIAVEGPDLPELFARLVADPPDLVFNLCESLCGSTSNEAVVPALLDMLGVPYTGPPPLTLNLCLHKDRAKEVLRAHEVSTPDYAVVRRVGDIAAAAALGYPLFLKLVREDASVGIEASNLVRTDEELRARSTEMIERYRQAVVAERFVDGREVNVTLLGNAHDGGEPQVLPLHEIDFGSMPADRPHIVSYAAKWDENHVDYEGTKPVPMRDVSPELFEAIASTARAAFRALDLRDFGRVDLRIDRHGRPWVIDVNPNCDLSRDAGVARSARHAGIQYPQLVGTICETAWSRYATDRQAAHSD